MMSTSASNGDVCPASPRHVGAEARQIALGGLRQHSARDSPLSEPDEPVELSRPCRSLVAVLEDMRSPVSLTSDTRRRRSRQPTVHPVAARRQAPEVVPHDHPTPVRRTRPPNAGIIPFIRFSRCDPMVRFEHGPARGHPMNRGRDGGFSVTPPSGDVRAVGVRSGGRTHHGLASATPLASSFPSRAQSPRARQPRGSTLLRPRASGRLLQPEHVEPMVRTAPVAIAPTTPTTVSIP
jgi:hypothetical protein